MVKAKGVCSRCGHEHILGDRDDRTFYCIKCKEYTKHDRPNLEVDLRNWNRLNGYCLISGYATPYTGENAVYPNGSKVPRGWYLVKVPCPLCGKRLYNKHFSQGKSIGWMISEHT